MIASLHHAELLAARLAVAVVKTGVKARKVSCVSKNSELSARLLASCGFDFPRLEFGKVHFSSCIPASLL